MNSSFQDFLSRLSLKEQAIVQHSLQGGSVIDWPRIFFENADDVKKFLKINEFDLEKPKDKERITTIQQEALDYLKNQLGLSLPEALCLPEAFLDLFLAASSNAANVDRRLTCALLKAMNIINHIDGRELLYNCPISLRDLFSLVEDKVERSLSYLNRNSACLLSYEGGRKTKESLITKLLSKRETIAAKINDRVRYRIVARTEEDVIKTLLYLFDSILPFNYVIPDASVNQLLTLDFPDLRDLDSSSVTSPQNAEKYARWGVGGESGFSPEFAVKQPALPVRTAIDSAKISQRPRSAFSGESYKVCKFVVDIPVRLDNFLALSGSSAYRQSLGTIAYVLVEFQIVDEKTASINNSGESSHENYKKRQKAGVLKRLS